MDDLRNVLVLLPGVGEQELIIAYLDERTTEINKSIERVTAEIGLLREYLARLNADVVTGKLDVRGVQLSGIEPSEELEPLAEADEDEADSETELVGAGEADDAAN